MSTRQADATAPGRPPQAASSAKKYCDHCGLVVPAALVEPDTDTQFCCGGCRVAYETIRGCGLEDFYAFRESAGDPGQASAGVGDRYAAYDADAFQQKHTRAVAGGLRSIELRLEGVHCAACVWLVERLPRIVPGVVEARLSLASSAATVVWDPQRAPLSSVAQAIDRLGYRPHPARETSARDVRLKVERSRLVRMAIAGALAGNNMLIALALYAAEFSGIEARLEELFRWLTMAIGLLSLAWPGRLFFGSAWSAVRARSPNLDLPIALALGAGAAAGTANVLLGRGDVYFDSLSVLVFLLLVGRFLQARQQRWAEDSISQMLSLTPDTCRVVRGDRLVEEPVEALAAGDEVEVRAGELCPADGEVTAGNSAIDRSLLTGESVPYPVAPGDTVHAGAHNTEATLRVTVTAVGSETRVARLLELVDIGLRSKPRVVRFADRVSGYFVAAMVGLAVANFTGWALASGVEAAVDTTVALLIVACPCALGLATPLTMAIAIGRASRRGALVKSAASLEQLAGGGRLLLDKTGTLTRGELRVVDWHGDRSLLALVGALEAESNHPLGRAIHGYCLAELGSERIDAGGASVWDRTETHGCGITAETDRGRVLIGSPRWVAGECVAPPPHLAEALAGAGAQGMTGVMIAVDGRVVAIVWLADRLHEDAATSVTRLRGYGWRPEVLSGDSPGPVASAAAKLGIGPANAHAEQTPEAKLAFVREAVQARGAGEQSVVMVGDGVNDAAALAAADVGIAVHGGAEAALAAADVYLGKPGVGSIVSLVRLARRTMAVVRRNLVLSLSYNALAVGLAIAGLITPLVAAVLMPISSATVLASAIYGLSVGESEKP